MEWINHLALGFGVALTPVNLVYVLLGCLLGSLTGVLPGMGPVATIAMVLPATYALPPVSALIMLAGIYHGAQYAGSSTAILVSQGRAGHALVAAGLGSFFAGCVGTLILAACVPVLTALALPFGPAETFALMVLGLMGAVVLASGSLLKAIAMAVLGLLLGLVGTDSYFGLTRFAWDIPELAHGIGFAALAMGVFGYGEIISNLATPKLRREVVTAKVQGGWPTRQDFKDMAPAVLRGTALGALAGAQTSFIPLLALGIPSNAVMALMVAAMTIHKIQPGPQMLTSNPEVFWGLMASMWIGNLVLIMLNLPLIGFWTRLLTVPYRWLFPAMVLFCAMGVYTIHHSSFDIWLVAVFGFIGYVFNKLGMEPAPLLLGFILGPMMEENLRGALLLSGGDWSVLVSRPGSAGLLAAALCLAFLVLLRAVQSRRDGAFVKE